MSNQGFGDFDRLRHRSPSPMASSNLLSNVGGTGLSGWNGIPQEVIASFDFNLYSIFSPTVLPACSSLFAFHLLTWACL